jgi:hypothetical protein
MQQTRIYPLGKEASAKQMQFPDASAVPSNMFYPQDGTAFDMLARFISHEYVDPADTYMRGMAAALGIVKNEAFAPDPPARALLDKAAKPVVLMKAEGTGPPKLMVHYCREGHIQPTRVHQGSLGESRIGEEVHEDIAGGKGEKRGSLTCVIYLRWRGIAQIVPDSPHP